VICRQIKKKMIRAYHVSEQGYQSNVKNKKKEKTKQETRRKRDTDLFINEV